MTEARQPTRIVVRPDGPLIVEGDCPIVDDAGNRYAPRAGKSPGKVALCRCGHSAEKPWCDGAHKRVGFRSPPESSAPVEAPPASPGSAS